MQGSSTWEPPGPGPWQQDSAHNPVAQTVLMQEIYPHGFNRGMEETFAAFGVLLDRLAMGVVNGFTYHQPQPFDLPGPDGPKDPDWVHAEVGRRAEVAGRAVEGRIWREALRRWDDELKPAARTRHRELAAGLAALDDEQLHVRVLDCLEHVKAMVYQHHRFNAHALLPVGDFMLQAAQLTNRPPMSLMGVFDGHSPVSSVAPPEMQAALQALREDPAGRKLLFADDEPGRVLDELRTRLPEVDDYVASVHFRLLEGFDVTNPTVGEQPEYLIGRMRAALDVDHAASLQRADAFAAELRAAVPEEHRAHFDDLLAEARLVYRLRDERGLYSDISAIGLVRLVLLEFGRRLVSRGRLQNPDEVLEASVAELESLFAGADTPTAAELQQRGADRQERTRAGAPRHLGPPAPGPPPADMLPPPLARVMGAVGFAIDGVLGQLDSPRGDGSVIGGIAGAAGVYEGTARLMRSVDELFEIEPGDVLVTPTTGEAFNSILHLIGAIVTDHGSFASHAAIVGREMGIPAVVGTVDGTRRIPSGTRVRVDGDAGEVILLE